MGLGWRLGIGLLVFPALAAVSAAQTLAIVGESKNPDTMLAIAPWDGAVRASFAKAAYQGQVGASVATASPPAAGIETLAREAYESEPLSPGALAVIGAGMPAAKRAQFWYAAARTSRRDALLQGLLLQHYAEAGNLDRSIRVLNQILQVRAEQRPQLYPVLIGALRDRRSIDAFVDILGSGPEWADSFLVAAAGDKQAIDNLAAVLKRLPKRITDEDTDRDLMFAFARSNRLDLAYEFYTHIARGRSDRAGPWNSELPPFDWALVGEPGFRAQKYDDAQNLRVDIARGKGGVFATRLIPSAPGPIAISGKYEIQPERQAERLEASLVCSASGSTIARSNFSHGRISLIAEVPQDCGFIAILLSGRAWSDAQRITGTISPLVVKHGG